MPCRKRARMSLDPPSARGRPRPRPPRMWAPAPRGAGWWDHRGMLSAPQRGEGIDERRVRRPRAAGRARLSQWLRGRRPKEAADDAAAVRPCCSPPPPPGCRSRPPRTPPATAVPATASAVPPPPGTPSPSPGRRSPRPTAPRSSAGPGTSRRPTSSPRPAWCTTCSTCRSTRAARPWSGCSPPGIEVGPGRRDAATAGMLFFTAHPRHPRGRGRVVALRAGLPPRDDGRAPGAALALPRLLRPRTARPGCPAT